MAHDPQTQPTVFREVPGDPGLYKAEFTWEQLYEYLDSSTSPTQPKEPTHAPQRTQ